MTEFVFRLLQTWERSDQPGVQGGGGESVVAFVGLMLKNFGGRLGGLTSPLTPPHTQVWIAGLLVTDDG